MILCAGIVKNLFVAYYFQIIFAETTVLLRIKMQEEILVTDGDFIYAKFAVID